MPTPPPPYTILRIPRASPRAAALVAKSRESRLHALEKDPSSFLAQLDSEARLPLPVWEKRLLSPEVTVWVCVASASSTSSSSLPSSSSEEEEGEEEDTAVHQLLTHPWLATAALRHLDHQTHHASPAAHSNPLPVHPAAETQWHLFDVYTLPAHRGQGIARRMVEACFATAAALSRHMSMDDREVQIERVRVRLFMDPNKEWLRRWYEGFGFLGRGGVTAREAFAACLMGDSVLEMRGGGWDERVGLVMERVVGLEGGNQAWDLQV